MHKLKKHKIPLYRQVFPLQLSLVALLLLAVGCSSVPTHKPIPPEISIAAVKPLNLSLSGQKLMFSLRVSNPNNYDLPLKSMNFIASFAGEDIATGSTNNKVRIPANGEAIVDVAVVAGLNTIINKLSSMADSGNLQLQYGVKGIVKLSNWPLSIPFDVKGDATTEVQDKLSVGLQLLLPG